MKARYSLVVVGGGPAGMAAAQSASSHGLDVAVVDEQERPGGQIYRNVDDSPLPDPGVLGADYTRGQQVTSGFRNAGVDYYPGTAVWDIGPDGEICVMAAGANRSLHAGRIVLATGAQERPMPFPGWQLPGVMTAGAGQILLKSAAMVPSDGIVLAGSGPLLLLLAWQYMQAGVQIQAIVDTTPRDNLSRAASHLAGALGSPAHLLKGARLISAIRRANIPVYKQATTLEACGSESLEVLKFSCRGRNCELYTSTLLLHIGVIPQTYPAMVAGCDMRWDEDQLCWRPAVDQWGGSTVPGISVAGDGAGIVGARASELQGRLTGLQCAYELGALDRDRRGAASAPFRRSLEQQLRIRPFLDALYRPCQEFLTPVDATMVCRCEEVSAGEIRNIARLGCQGPNQAKVFSRCGMGPCQGRQCGGTVAALIAQVQQRDPSDVGYYRARPPLKPITLGQMGSRGV